MFLIIFEKYASGITITDSKKKELAQMPNLNKKFFEVHTAIIL